MAQTAADHLAELQKVAAKTLKQTKKAPAAIGAGGIDGFVLGIFNLAVGTSALTEQLDGFYSRSIGQTIDGITDVTIKKPTLPECIVLSKTLIDNGLAIADMVKAADSAAKEAKEINNPAQAAKAAKAVASAVALSTIIVEESAVQVKLIDEMVKSAKAGL
ncbi:MAG: hypothetical protein SNG97_05100 [Rikenellaceae bacterium]